MAPVNIIYFLSQQYFYFFMLVNTELYKCRSLSIIKKTTKFSKIIQNFQKKSKFSTKIFKIQNFQQKKTFAHLLFLFSVFFNSILHGRKVTPSSVSSFKTFSSISSLYHWPSVIVGRLSGVFL